MRKESLGRSQPLLVFESERQGSHRRSFVPSPGDPSQTSSTEAFLRHEVEKNLSQWLPRFSCTKLIIRFGTHIESLAKEARYLFLLIHSLVIGTEAQSHFAIIAMYISMKSILIGPAKLIAGDKRQLLGAQGRFDYDPNRGVLVLRLMPLPVHEDLQDQITEEIEAQLRAAAPPPSDADNSHLHTYYRAPRNPSVFTPTIYQARARKSVRMCSSASVPQQRLNPLDRTISKALWRHRSLLKSASVRPRRN